MDRPFITRMRYDYSVRCVAVDRVTGTRQAVVGTMRLAIWTCTASSFWFNVVVLDVEYFTFEMELIPRAAWATATAKSTRRSLKNGDRF